MAKFTFKLQSFLSLKEKIEEQRKLEYGRAVSALEQEKLKKARLVHEKNRQTSSFREQIETSIKPQTLIGYHHYIGYLKVKVAEQDGVIDKAQVFAEQKREALVGSMHERKILEKLKEKAHVAYTKAEQIAEQKQTDELVSYRYNNRT